MTCRTSGADWRDVLYNAVRATPGGVVDAARYLTERRGRTIHAETLRTRLRHVDGESISLDIVELLTEWMSEKARPDALAWLDTINAQYGRVVADHVQGRGNLSDIQRQALSITRQVGDLAGAVIDAVADHVITSTEADVIAAEGRELLHEVGEILVSVQEARQS